MLNRASLIFKQLSRQRASFCSQSLVDISNACQVLALIGIRNSHDLVAENISIIQENVRLAEKFFERYAPVYRLQALLSRQQVCESPITEAGNFYVHQAPHGKPSDAED